MSTRSIRWLPWLLWLYTVIVATAGVYLLSVGAFDASSPNLFGHIADFENFASPAFLGIIGPFVASRRPRNPIGWLLTVAALAATTNPFLQSYATYGLLTRPGSLPGATTVFWVANAFWPLQWPGLLLLLLLFPNGHLPSPRWRPVAWLAVIVPALYVLLSAVYPGPIPGFESYINPIGLTAAPAELLQPIYGSPIFFAAFPSVQLVVSALAVIARFRKARGDQRQQLKWFAYASVLAICIYALDALGLLGGAVASIVQGLAIDGLVLAIAFAVLRYRLYDIDVIIRRTLIYGAMTACLVMLYLGCVIVLQAVFRTLTGQSSDLAIVASTLGIAAMFQSLRSSVQRLIDRRFYRHTYDAAQVLAAFGTTSRDEVELSHLTDRLVEVVGETMQPTQVSLWLREMKNAMP